MPRAVRSLSNALAFTVLGFTVLAGTLNAEVPAGTRVQVRLLDQLNTGKAQIGQTFSATVASPVVVGRRTVLPAGTKVSGRVVEAVSSGRLKRPASITLELTQAGDSAITTELLRIDGKSHLLRNAGIIGGESGAGAIVGAAAAGKKGALIGAGIGAGAGTATAYMTGKQEIVLPVETALTFLVVDPGSASGAITASRQEIRQRERQTQDPFFSERDRRLIRLYFAGNTQNLPPGLAKRGGHLPPGLEKHLERDGTLPPGLQKRVEPFPSELEVRLPRLPGGHVRVILGGRALILNAEGRIADLMFIHRSDDDQGEDEDEDDR